MPGTDNRGFLTEARDKDLDQVSERHHCPIFLSFFSPPEFLSRQFGGKDLGLNVRNYLGSQKSGMKIFFKWFKIKGLYPTPPNIVP